MRFLLFLRAVAIGGEVGAESAEAFSGQAPDADSGTICLFELSIVRDLPACGKLRLCMLERELLPVSWAAHNGEADGWGWRIRWSALQGKGTEQSFARQSRVGSLFRTAWMWDGQANFLA
jgi:hypothetical protein